MSVRLKLTLWFGLALTIIVALTIGAVFLAENSVLHKSLRDSVITSVEGNFDDLEFYTSLEDMLVGSDGDSYIEYNGGYIEIDDGFLSNDHNVYTGVYTSHGELLYGENPMGAETRSLPFENSVIRPAGKGENACYVFDRKLTGEGLDDLWLRGTVRQDQRKGELNLVVRLVTLLLPVLLVAAILGGYLIAARTLRPLEKISATASAISGGSDLKKRIDIGKGKDEIHDLADSFNRMIDRLDRSFESEKQFTSDVSHELRTPVSVISAQCDLTLEEDRTTEEYAEALTAIRRQSSSMSRMIADMLDFVRLEQNTEAYQKESVDLSGLVRSLCEDLSLIGERGITLEHRIQEDITLFGNDRLLARLVTNLISNAYRYGKEDGRILVELSGDEKVVSLSVTDDGIGISQEHLPKIFDRFFRVDTSRNSKGTGLGLPMAKEIAHFHDGEITVMSTPEKGSRFTVVFPKR